MNELHHLANPGGSSGLLQLVEGLESEAILVEDLDGHFEHLAVLHAALEVLLGQGLLEVDGGAILVRAVDQVMGQLAVEHQVAVEEEHVIVHVLAGEVHGVDVVCLHINIVGHEGEGRLGEVGGLRLQLLGEGTGGDDKLGHALGNQQTQLAVEDGLAVLQQGHGLVVGLGFVAHAVTQAGVENNRLHI